MKWISKGRIVYCEITSLQCICHPKFKNGTSLSCMCLWVCFVEGQRPEDEETNLLLPGIMLLKMCSLFLNAVQKGVMHFMILLCNVGSSYCAHHWLGAQTQFWMASAFSVYVSFISFADWVSKTCWRPIIFSQITANEQEEKMAARNGKSGILEKVRLTDLMFTITFLDLYSSLS